MWRMVEHVESVLENEQRTVALLQICLLYTSYENRTDNFLPSADEAAKPESLKSVHKLITKVSEDIEKFSYNTSISAFMLAVNELGQQKCRNTELLTDLVILIAPFAQHIRCVSETAHQALRGEGFC